ncbi:MAG TPA: OmpA family protein [Bryobacteraceae bacterium]|jgi:outer membrane protein OmpA-like peptidoglycan-associated protein
MDFMTTEVWGVAAAAAFLFFLIGWFVRGVVGQGRSRAIEINKDIEIENLQADLESSQKAYAEAAMTLEKSNAQGKDLQAKLEAAAKDSVQQLAASKARHDSELAAVKTKLAALEPLQNAVAERDTRIEGWQNRFDGFVLEKDLALANVRALSAELAEQKGKLASMGAALAAAEAHKDSLTSQLAAHEGVFSSKDASIAALQKQLAETQAVAEAEPLHAALAEKDQIIADQKTALAAAQSKMTALVDDHQTRFAEITALVAQRDEQLKSFDQRMRGATAEKDTVISRLRGMVAQIEPLRADLAERDRTIEALQANSSDAMKSALADKEQVISSLQLQVADSAATHASLIAALEAKASEKNDRISHLESQIVDTTGRHAAAKSELDNWESRFASLEAQSKQQASNYQAALDNLEAKQHELDRAHGEIRGLDSHLMAALAAASPASAELISDLRAQIAAFDQAKTTENDRISHLETQIVDTTGRHAAAKSELDNWESRFAALESQSKQQAANHLTTLNTLEAKQQEIDRAQAEIRQLDSKLMAALSAPNELNALKGRVADLEKALDQELPREAQLRAIIATNESELTELRAQIADRDERLEAWDSRFHASLGELHGEVGNLTARTRAYESELLTLKNELASAPLSMAAAAGAGSSSVASGSMPSAPSKPPRVDNAQLLKERLSNGLPTQAIQFLPFSAELLPQSLPVLEEAANALHEFPDVPIEIAGHTDSWGQPHDNLRLSQKRAATVREYLLNSGIAPWRLIDVGHGDTQPVESNDTPDGRFANRRIELRVRQ